MILLVHHMVGNGLVRCGSAFRVRNGTVRSAVSPEKVKEAEDLNGEADDRVPREDEEEASGEND